MTVTHLVVGPPRHGVVTFALNLTEALRRMGRPIALVRQEHWAALDSTVARMHLTAGVHLNFTDRLFGPNPADAAQRVVALARLCESMGARVSATLHDVPQPADGGNYLQRVAAYRAVCATLHAVSTNSEHERSLLDESGIAARADIVVVPLPLDVNVAAHRHPVDGPCSVAVLGFVYPGKGHGEVLAAMTGLPASAEFIAIGECSTGHEDLVQQIAKTAEHARRKFSITGYVPAESLSAVLHQVTVPVAHHRHVSASGSINSWIEAHRRPLAPVNRYTTEHSLRHPGTLTLYADTPTGLREAIEHASCATDSTWLSADSGSGWSSNDAAARYAQTLSQWHD